MKQGCILCTCTSKTTCTTDAGIECRPGLITQHVATSVFVFSKHRGQIYCDSLRRLDVKVRLHDDDGRPGASPGRLVRPAWPQEPKADSAASATQRYVRTVDPACKLADVGICVITVKSCVIVLKCRLGNRTRFYCTAPSLKRRTLRVLRYGTIMYLAYTAEGMAANDSRVTLSCP